ncbi:hypothetical protein [Parabacteroides sp.]
MNSLTLVPIGGLANRIYAISSAIALCEKNQIRLKIIWFKGWGMGSRFHSLFEISPEWKNVEIVDAKWYHYLYDRPRKKNFWLPYIWQRIAFRKRVYEKDILAGFSVDQILNAIKTSSPVYLVHYCEFYTTSERTHLLIPIASIIAKIQDRVHSFSLRDNVIGIHIRRGDHQSAILKSPLSLFIGKMNEEIINDPSVRFYVASDSYSEKEKLKDLFGERILTIFEEVRRDNKAGIENALIELYALSATKKIYGSVASTYSQLAAKLGGIEIDVLSIE